MKRLILILMLLPLFAVAQTNATGNFASAVYSTHSTDTVSNAGTKYLVASPVSAGYIYCQTIATLTNISGTTAMTVTLQHSIDGTNWTSYPTDSVLTFAAAGTQGIKWVGYTDSYLRLKFVGTGTQSTQIKASYQLRK